MDSVNYNNSFWYRDRDHVDAFDNFKICLSCIDNIAEDLKWNEKELRKFKDKFFEAILKSERRTQ